MLSVRHAEREGQREIYKNKNHEMAGSKAVNRFNELIGRTFHTLMD